MTSKISADRRPRLSPLQALLWLSSLVLLVGTVFRWLRYSDHPSPGDLLWAAGGTLLFGLLLFLAARSHDGFEEAEDEVDEEEEAEEPTPEPHRA